MFPPSALQEHLPAWERPLLTICCFPFFFFRAGKTYRLRISNVGLQNTLNFLIQGHNMTLVEVEGTHTVQNSYTSIDVHAGQSLSVLFTADRPARDYHVAVSTRFANTTLRSTAAIRYAGSSGPAFDALPDAPSDDVDFSLNQARSIRYKPADLGAQVPCAHLGRFRM
jgi:FtsP/CotA-like multicopper oxidase with cupredoxin domain